MDLTEDGVKELFKRSEDELCESVKKMDESLSKNAVPSEHAKHPMSIALNAFFDAVVRPAL